jgi:xylan 1,4-beta-xylosidase
MEWDYRQSPDPEGPQFSGILLQEYHRETQKLIGPVRKIFTGSPIGCVEGPHLYKRKGWYYLLTAEGGTVYNHAATVARSRSLEGPYEIHPHNPLISSRDRPELTLQKAGHASWCETPEGRTYLAYLCGRPLAHTKHCVLGRETALAELVWHEDWPYVKGEQGERLNYPTDTFEPPVPQAKSPAPAKGETQYIFDGPELPGDFKTLRVPADLDRYSLSARRGYLRLRGGQSPVSPYGQTLLARRQQDFSFDAETCVDFSPTSFQELAGLCWRYDERNQYLLALTHDEKRGRVLSVLSLVAGRFSREAGPVLNVQGPVWLGVSVREHQGVFRYSTDGSGYTEIGGPLDSQVLSDEFDGLGFTGAFVGIFCVDTGRYAAFADFSRFVYRPVSSGRDL